MPGAMRFVNDVNGDVLKALANDVPIPRHMAEIVEIRKNQATEPWLLSTTVHIVDIQASRQEANPFRFKEKLKGVHVACNSCNQEIAVFPNYRVACLNAYKWLFHSCAAAPSSKL